MSERFVSVVSAIIVLYKYSSFPFLYIQDCRIFQWEHNCYKNCQYNCD